MPPGLKFNENFHIFMEPITSSNLKEVGYDEKRQTLEVEFLHAREVYRYFSISRGVFDAMMSASTPGQYFYHFIRTSYPYIQI